MNTGKITVLVICPAVSGKYDFRLDSEMTAGEAIQKIAEQIRKYENADCLFRSDGLLLFSEESDRPVNPDVTLEEYGIVNGSRLMLI